MNAVNLSNLNFTGINNLTYTRYSSSLYPMSTPLNTWQKELSESFLKSDLGKNLESDDRSFDVNISSFGAISPFCYGEDKITITDINNNKSMFILLRDTHLKRYTENISKGLNEIASCFDKFLVSPETVNHAEDSKMYNFGDGNVKCFEFYG